MRALFMCFLVACSKTTPASVAPVGPVANVPAPPSATAEAAEPPIAISSETASLVAPSVKELCAAVVRRDKEALARAGGFAHLHPKPPTCEKTSISVDGSGKKGSISIRPSAVHVENGLSSASYLVLETPRGFMLTPVHWSFDSRNSGTPAWQAQHIEHIESVDDTRFVVYLLGLDVSKPTRSDRREVRGAYACALTSEKLACAAYDPVEHPPLGVRVIPAGTPPAKVDDVPWAAPYRLVETKPGAYVRVAK